MDRTKCECFKVVKDHRPCSFSKNDMLSSFGIEQINFTEITGPGSLTYEHAPRKKIYISSNH